MQDLMTVRLNDWIENAAVDYMAGRASIDDPKRPVSVALFSAPGTSKSSQIQRVLPRVLEDAYCSDLDPVDTSDLPEIVRNACVHFSPNGNVAVLTEMINTRDAPDIRGFMVPRKDGTSQYLTPDLVVAEQALYDMGCSIVVLFLDEFGGTDHLTQKALTPVFLDGLMGSRRLAPSTWVIGASNRQSDGAGVNRMLTILVNRINVLSVYLHIDDYVSYATEHLDVPPMLLAYARKNPGKVSTDAPPKDGPFPSYRSVTYAGEWMSAYKRSIGDTNPMTLPLVDDEYAQSKVAGFVGQGLMVELSGYAKLANELPDIEDIERDPEGAHLPERHRMDALYAVSQMCCHFANADNVEQVWKYIERLPKELQVGTARQVMKQGYGVSINSPTLSRWIKENRALLRNALVGC